MLKTVTYTIGHEHGLRMAVVADFHDRDPEPVIEAVRAAKPDVVLLTGDTLERHDENMHQGNQKEMNAWQGLSTPARYFGRFLNFVNRAAGALTGGSEHIRTDERNENGIMLLRGIADIAPVFMSVGNHEWYFEESDTRTFEELGITLLDNADVEWNGLRIGGLSTKYHVEWLRAFSKKDGYKILLCHHPEYYKCMVEAVDTFDLILSGHAHGGQWRIGSIGIFSPGQGFFPKLTHGKHKTRAGRMIVSAGVSNTANVPRLGNPCELVIVEI